MSSDFRDRVRELLQRHEGLRLTAYQDVTGHATIGYGHNLAVPIPRATAELILDADLDTTLREVREQLPWADTLAEPRRAVLVDMAFNLGIGGLLAFHRFLGALQMGDWEQAATDMLDSLWARQVGPRALRLASMMRSGDWPA